MFLLFGVNEIKLDLPPSSSIYFQVGIITKKLSVDQFVTIHSCSKNNAFLFQGRFVGRLRGLSLKPLSEIQIHFSQAQRSRRGGRLITN
ncbi:hypothetical protein RND81_10G069400 [Saponaria officinalis]|uniref:Uncharacterized protein n=1 Tax=Saponaria officinalis TaxID=3572 RepID=A0AAW1I185_SAPOF